MYHDVQLIKLEYIPEKRKISFGRAKEHEKLILEGYYSKILPEGYVLYLKPCEVIATVVANSETSKIDFKEKIMKYFNMHNISETQVVRVRNGVKEGRIKIYEENGEFELKKEH